MTVAEREVAANSSGEWISTPEVATQQEVANFVEQGFLALPGLIADQEIEEIKEDTFRLARGGYPCETLKPLPREMSDDEALAYIKGLESEAYLEG